MGEAARKQVEEQHVIVTFFMHENGVEVDVWKDQETFEMAMLDMMGLDENLPLTGPQRKALYAVLDKHGFNTFWECLQTDLHNEGITLEKYERRVT